jgi:two-component system response regulator RpfG
MDRVLVVDDEPGIRGLLVNWAEGLGCAVHAAASADQALEYLQQSSVDVAVCDVNLPGKDGLWLARQLRLQSPETAVVMTTGLPHLEEAVRGLRVGVADYLLKPFGRERFREALDRAHRWHETARETAERRRAVELELLTRRGQLLDAVLRLQPADDEAVLGLVGLLTVRDRPSYSHATRVAALVYKVGVALGVPASVAADLRRAAWLHETARSVVPETVLWKAGELSDDEWAVLRSQPRVAFEIFREAPFLAPAAAIIRSMRERWDGQGYPERLAGEEIPFASRVLCACDAYDTMLHPMGHRDSMTPAEAAGEIRAERGRQFDPRVSDVLLESVDGSEPATVGVVE